MSEVQTEADGLMRALRSIEEEASRSSNWVHYKGWNDVKTTFNNALAICEELRSWAKDCRHGETKELPPFAKSYIREKMRKIEEALE